MYYPAVEEFKIKKKLSPDFCFQPIRIKFPSMLSKFLTRGFQIESGFGVDKKSDGPENSMDIKWK